MTYVSTTKDVENLSLTIVAEFPAAPEDVWNVWADARKLERWWGPPTFPATFTRHDFVVDGESRYHMNGPNGEVHHGFWRIQAIDKPHSIDFLNGLAGADGEPLPDMPPMRARVSFDVLDTGTRMTAVSRFIDTAQMERMLGMGMAEGMALAIGQIDGLLAQASV